MSDLLSTREAVRIELVRSVVKGEGTLELAWAQALRLGAATLHVRRVSIWLGEDGWRRVRCRMAFDARSERLFSGDVIDLESCPKYSVALRSRRAIVADDALADERTSELRSYLETNQITSMLDGPVFLQGELVGIVCFEHVGEKRSWTKQDSDFVSTVSDMIGLYLEQEQAQRTADQLLEARAALEKTRIMESLGRMAAGVAHDFNNVLAAVGLKAELLQRKPGDAAAVERSAGDVLALVDQGARLVRQLMTFARQEPTTLEVVDLAELLRTMEPVLRAMARDEISLELAPGKEPVRVRITRGRAEQVIMNLAVNARDAMLGGGTLRIGVSRDPSAQLAVLRVGDTGVGMDEHVKSRIFEPFFTTKTHGAGVGLGLATVYGIVMESGGRIDVTSQVGEGTEFVLRFPLVSG